MRVVLQVFLLLSLTSAVTFAQRKPVQKTPSAKPPAVVPIKEIVDRGEVSGQIYRNEKLGFSITFPDSWRVRENGFEDEMFKQGFDIRLKAPDNLGMAEKARMNQSLKRVEVLVTASRSLPGTADNAIVRVSAEDLKAAPRVKDAVDYFDAMRATFKTMRLPSDLKYSETQAERLGPHQFAFLDISSSAGKKRMYATVRGGFAILFALSYTSDEDLQTMRQILTTGNFGSK